MHWNLGQESLGEQGVCGDQVINLPCTMEMGVVEPKISKKKMQIKQKKDTEIYNLGDRLHSFRILDNLEKEVPLKRYTG